MGNTINVDRNTLWLEATKLDVVKKRVSDLQKRISTLYWRTGNYTIRNISHQDVLGKSIRKIDRCKNILDTLAHDLGKLEQSVESGGLVLENLYSLKSLDAISDVHTKSTWADFKNMVNRCLDEIKGTSSKLFDDMRDAGDALNWLEGYCDKMPNLVTHAIEVALPDSLKEAYTLTTGILQHDLTLEEGWDVAKNMLSQKLNVAVFCESLDYTFKNGKEREEEMQRQMTEQIKEGDILGVAIDGAEGFVDTILGGSVEVLGKATGTILDNAIEETKILNGVNKFTEYVTGVFGVNDGEGYSVGGLIGAVGEGFAEGIDKTTDFITNATDVVTDAITGDAKAGIKWVKSWFN